MAYDAAEEMIRVRMEGLENVPQQFDAAIESVKKFSGALQGLQQQQATLQKQYSTAAPQQQPAIQKQLNKLDYQIDQAATARQQATGHAESVYTDLQQLRELTRRLDALEQARAATPPPPGPLENLSPEVAQTYTDKASDLAQAQGKFKRARSDNSRQQWAQEIDRLQTDLEKLPGEAVRVAYKAPIDEIRRRLQTLQQKTGRGATNAEFTQVEREVAQGRFVTPEEDEEADARRMAIMNPANARQRFAARIRQNWREGGINLGYAALQAGDAAAQYAELNLSGQRVTPEARQRSLAAAAPAIGAAVGGLIGGWPGSLIGGGVGSAAQGIFDAKSERDEKVRLASEEISTALGLGASAGKQFASVLESSSKALGTPVVELASAMTQIAHAGSGFNMQGATGLQAYLQSQLGDQYAATVGPQVKAASTPFSQGYRDMLLGKTPPSASTYESVASYYDATGDRGTADTLRGVGAALGTDPRIAKLQAKINFTRANHPYTMGGLADKWLGFQRTEVDAQGKKHDVVETVYDQRIHSWQREIDHLKGQSASSLAASPDKAAGDALADAVQNGRDTASYGQSQAAAAGSYAQQALRRGRGVAGMRQYEVGQVSSLTSALSGMQAQQKALQDRIHALGDNSPGAGALKTVLSGVNAQLADLTGQIAEVGIGDFAQQNAEDESHAQGRMQRTGTRGQELTQRGLTVRDKRVQQNYAQQRQLGLAEAARLQSLAADQSNSLSPEEREDYQTRARTLRFQSTVGQANEIEGRRLGEQAAVGQVRQSRIERRAAVAETGGTAGDVYQASMEAVNETLRRRKELQGELSRMEQQSIGTAGQRAQIESQINDLSAQAVRNAQAARQARYQTQEAEIQAVGETATARARRLTFAGGTTQASYDQSSLSLKASRDDIAMFKKEAEDTSLSPRDQKQRQAKYEKALADYNEDVVTKLGTYEESPAVRRQRIALEGAAQRMAISPFVPGNRLGVASRMVKLDQGTLAGIDAEMRRVQNDKSLKDDERANALAKLEQTQQEYQTKITQESSSVAEQMFSDRIAQSIGASSFASRILPSASDVAGLAERKGLGPISARVFGFTKASTYRDTMQYGLMAPDQQMNLYGKRPGDLLGGVGGAWASGGAGGGGAGQPGLGGGVQGGFANAAGRVSAGAGGRLLRDLPAGGLHYVPMNTRYGRDAAGHGHTEGYLVKDRGDGRDATGRRHSLINGALLTGRHSAAMDLTTGKTLSMSDNDVDDGGGWGIRNGIGGGHGAAIGGGSGSATGHAAGDPLIAAMTTLATAFHSGLTVNVTVTNPDTGTRTAHVVNALKNGDSRAIQRGGAAQGPRY